jgi:hypothetical protein
MSAPSHGEGRGLGEILERRGKDDTQAQEHDEQQ